jgi:hypothetical protein
MSTWMRIALPVAVVVATGCIPEADYAGDYDMTYDVVMSPVGAPQSQALAGTATVTVHHGLDDEYLVDLGSSFCGLEGTYEKAMIYSDWPYMQIDPQDCWFISGAKTMPISLSGTATFDKGDNRFTIVLAGNYTDDNVRGSATVQFTESW